MAVRWGIAPVRLGRSAITATRRLLGLGSRQLASWLVYPEDIRHVALLGVSDLIRLPGGGTPTGRNERDLGAARIVANQRGMLTAIATMLVEGPASVARLQLYFDDFRVARSAQQVDGDTTLTVLGSHVVEAGTHTIRVSYLSFDAPLNVFEFHGAALFVPGRMASGVTIQLPS